MSDEILKELNSLKDEKYADFQKNLIPGLSREYFIGVRTPELKKMAKRLYKDSTKKDMVDDFLKELPHTYFDENQLHGFIISECKDFDRCIEYIEEFLPHINNWATCDQTAPKIFKKYTKELLPYIKKWIKSKETYTIRFAIGMLMQHYLDEHFDEKYIKLVSSVKSDEYYINMEIAWYMATALAKQWDATIPYIENKKMPVWVHNKTIQKAVESYRITDEQKDYLRTLKIKSR